ncbi:AAA family ATPase [Kribbella flavida]|uniref:AAA family ATPase n=1 Tax=Kribbella flavida TaxID=182640 RepID=UPI00059E4CC1|nr:AAA family ATPase [Kribbella flavida]
MAQLIHLNGPPGIGKSTLAALHVDRHAGALNLDVDVVHRLIGGWQDEQNRTWQLVWPLVRVMAESHLRDGHDVVLPQYHAQLDEITALEDLARANGASFREVVLLDDREAAAERFDDRARDTDDHWVQHHHRLVALRGGSVLLGAMYDNLVEILRLRPEAVVVRSRAGAVQETYELLATALRC